MRARALIGRLVLAAIAAGGVAACKPDRAAPPRPAEGSVAGGGVSSGDPAQAKRPRPPMPVVPARGPDGKIIDVERKKPWANGERPTRDELIARRDARRKDMLEAFDTDQDGQLSEEERTEMRESRLAEIVARMDTDRDGKLSPAEVEAMPTRGRRAPPDFATLDSDKDGFVTIEEMAKNAPRPGRRGPGGGPGGADGTSSDEPAPAPDAK